MEAVIFGVLAVVLGAVASYWVSVEWGRFLLSTVVCLMGLGCASYMQGRIHAADVAEARIGAIGGRALGETIHHNSRSLEQWHRAKGEGGDPPDIYAFDPSGIYEEVQAAKEAIKPAWRKNVRWIAVALFLYGMLGMFIWFPDVSRWEVHERAKHNSPANQAKATGNRPKERSAKPRHRRRR